MEVKVQCECGAKYAFEVEPVNGRLPVPIACPQCGANGTDAANAIITQKLAQTASSPSVAPAAGKLRVKSEAPAASVSAPTAAPISPFCSKHPRTPATSQCFVCQKPICPECMSQFGYLCSVLCRYQAEQQGIRVPEYEFTKTRVQANWWKKVWGVAAGAVFLLAGLFGVYLWFYFSGSHPKPFYGMHFSRETTPLHAQFLGKDKILLLNKTALALHDVRKKADVWSVPIAKPEGEKKSSTRDDDFDYDFYSSSLDQPYIHVTKDEIWLAMPKQVVSVDPKTGAQKVKVPIEGHLANFMTGENALFVITKQDKKKSITRIEIPSGTAKTEELIVTPVETQYVAEEAPPGWVPTAAYHLDSELTDENIRQRALKKVYSQFVTTGANAAEVKIKMLEPNLVQVEAIKRVAKSSINENLSASTSLGVVAQEIFNDIKRSSGGGFKMVDQSRYQVTVRRLLTEGAQTWSGEVDGPPAFFAEKTVDVVVGGKMLYILDKQNRKIGESKLQNTIDERFARAGGVHPCLEVDNTLYFFDQGTLTAFDLPSCTVKWRLITVGTSKVLPDGKGHLYVNTTSDSPEDIQYSEQVKVMDKTIPLLLKVDAKTGNILWKGKHMSDCRLTGKYLYAATAQETGLAFTSGLREALNPYRPGSGSSFMRVSRVDPDNGTKDWEYIDKNVPQSVDFYENRILMNYGEELQVLKYFTF